MITPCVWLDFESYNLLLALGPAITFWLVLWASYRSFFGRRPPFYCGWPFGPAKDLLVAICHPYIVVAYAAITNGTRSTDVTDTASISPYVQLDFESYNLLLSLGPAITFWLVL